MDDILFNPLADDILEEKKPDISSPFETEPAVAPSELAHLRASLILLQKQVADILVLLNGQKLPPQASFGIHTLPQEIAHDSSDQQRVLEGTFDGDKMIGDDEGTYTIPPNYASKSKLVEGDRLKLTITANGSFIYKQVKPIGRKRLVGEMVFDQELNQWGVFSEGKLYKVLKASVTFYKGNAGDEAVILVADDRPCGWGAIENIIHK